MKSEQVTATEVMQRFNERDEYIRAMTEVWIKEFREEESRRIAEFLERISAKYNEREAE